MCIIYTVHINDNTSSIYIYMVSPEYLPLLSLSLYVYIYNIVVIMTIITLSHSGRGCVAYRLHRHMGVHSTSVYNGAKWVWCFFVGLDGLMLSRFCHGLLTAIEPTSCHLKSCCHVTTAGCDDECFTLRKPESDTLAGLAQSVTLHCDGK